MLNIIDYRTSRYLDNILNINNVHFDNVVGPKTLQSSSLIKLIPLIPNPRLSISNDIVSTKMYDKRDKFDFEMVNFQFLDGDVPRSISYRVYISQFIRFVTASSHVAEFNTQYKLLTQKRLRQGYQYQKVLKTFS